MFWCSSRRSVVRSLEHCCCQKILTVWHLTPQSQYAFHSLSIREGFLLLHHSPPRRSFVVQHKCLAPFLKHETWHPSAYFLSCTEVFLLDWTEYIDKSSKSDTRMASLDRLQRGLFDACGQNAVRNGRQWRKCFWQSNGLVTVFISRG